MKTLISMPFKVKVEKYCKQHKSVLDLSFQDFSKEEEEGGGANLMFEYLTTLEQNIADNKIKANQNGRVKLTMIQEGLLSLIDEITPHCAIIKR